MLSAIIPNYNHGDSIGKATAALLQQTVPPDEIIIVDDGSTDNSIEIIEKLASVEPRIRVFIHEKNRGAIAALNTGLMAAQGTLVYMAAADDVTKPELIKTLHEALKSVDGAAFASGEVAVYTKGIARPEIRPPVRPSNKLRYFDAQETNRLFKKMDNFILTGAALMRLSAVREAGFLKPELGAFADGFLVRQMAFRDGFVYVPLVLSEWHVSNSGLSRSAALNASSASAHVKAAAVFFKSDASIPSWYWPVFKRRWLFAILRISLRAPDAGKSVIREYAPGPGQLRSIFTGLATQGNIGRLICLSWATLWYRPTSVIKVLQTWLTRYKEAK